MGHRFAATGLTSPEGWLGCGKEVVVMCRFASNGYRRCVLRFALYHACSVCQ